MKKLSAAERKEGVLFVRVTKAEARAFLELATKKKTSVSEWLGTIVKKELARA